ncbi:hypothetical protein [Rhizobium leucaenae]|uniref:Uncharacterized protein n=1 Tax=Rhizobium leucaenae TaxID=29450 RepID=A0A7W6ZZP8_9HYPH|nr:hypothetical protein [Rhizobium leucaenae]MBB4571138.1 hypothetical protein [Rhizobium leucaenae]
MKNLMVGMIFAVAGTSFIYSISESYARAEDWGCKVILCLSNPGGPTQYAECRPPISRLWQELAKGRSFPTCSGIGFQATQPGYEPYYCNDGYKLTTGFGGRGEEATCVSAILQKVDERFCSSDKNSASDNHGLVISARWKRDGRHAECVGYPTLKPLRRTQPHYVDVIIDGVSSQRVWY